MKSSRDYSAAFWFDKLQFIGGMRASGGKLFGKKLGKNFQEFWVLTRVR